MHNPSNRVPKAPDAESPAARAGGGAPAQTGSESASGASVSPAAGVGAAKCARAKNGEMGLLDHLEELRIVIFKSLAVLMVAMILAGLFFLQLNDALLWPLNCAIADRPDRAEFLRMHTPFGVFSVVLEIAFVGGGLLALPFIAYFAAQFVAPALTRKERRLLAPLCGAALALFLMGAAFAFFFILPKGLSFALALNERMGFFMQPNVQDYYALLLWMLAGAGALFEFPLLLFALTIFGVVPVSALKKYRRYVIVLIFVAAAIVTPPDVISQLALGLPMVLMYEATILLSERFLRRRNAGVGRF